MGCHFRKIKLDNNNKKKNYVTFEQIFKLLKPIKKSWLIEAELILHLKLSNAKQ